MHSSNFNELLAKIKFNQDGLVPAIAQQYDSKEVLMMAWMNQEAIIETISTGQVCYYSRSRKKLQCMAKRIDQGNKPPPD